jgi:pimeloyl-ACP methyl ester carboxylesterase
VGNLASLIPYVLVHGGAHGAWCWERLQPHLDAVSLAVDLPGRVGKPSDLSSLLVADFARSVVEDIERQGYEEVVLVGHSIAGVTLPAVADLLGTRVRRMVFVSSAIPPEGGRIVDTLSPPLRWLCQLAVRRGNRAQVLPRRVASYCFCNDMDEETTRMVLERLTPEATGVLVERVTRRGPCSTVPRTYIKLLSDRTLGPKRQDAMIANLGGAEVLELDAGHDAMLSRPAALAELVVLASSDAPRGRGAGR